jgi:hypothetical protein
MLSLVEKFQVERIFYFVCNGWWYFNYDALGRCFSLHYFLSFFLLGLIGRIYFYCMKRVNCRISTNSKVDSVVLESILLIKIFLCFFSFVIVWCFVCFFGFSTCMKIIMVQKRCNSSRNNA